MIKVLTPGMTRFFVSSFSPHPRSYPSFCVPDVLFRVLTLVIVYHNTLPLSTTLNCQTTPPSFSASCIFIGGKTIQNEVGRRRNVAGMRVCELCPFPAQFISSFKNHGFIGISSFKKEIPPSDYKIIGSSTPF